MTLVQEYVMGLREKKDGLIKVVEETLCRQFGQLPDETSAIL